MPVVALQGQLRSPLAPFAVDTVAAWWWAAMREMCPSAVAAVVVPDGFQLVTACEDPAALFASVARRAARLTGRLSASRPVWRPMAGPRVASTLACARRWALEALQRPCRLGLADNPIDWRWSTARDQAGTVCDPWVDGGGWNGLVLRGAPIPLPRPEPRLRAAGRAGAPLAAIAMAAGESTRAPPAAIAAPGATRNVFVWLGRSQGWSPPVLASVCCASVAQVQAIAAEPNPAWRSAAARCLADPRLRGLWARAEDRDHGGRAG